MRFFFGAEPVAVSARAVFSAGPKGVDESAAAWLDFGNGRLGTLSCSFKAGFCQGLELVGTQGRAWIGKPWLQVDQTTQVMIERDGERTIQGFDPMNAYEALVRNFTRAVRDSSYGLRPGEDGCEQAVVMEGLVESARGRGAVWERPS